MFNTEEGFYVDASATSEGYVLDEGYLNDIDILEDMFFITNELAYTAYFKKDSNKLKVVKYVLSSGEVIEV